MKRIIILTILTIFCLNNTVSAQWGGNNATLSSGKDANVQWEKTIIDIGTIKQYNPTQAIFQFKNIGGKPIIITNAKGSCGCTDIDYPKKPILPGETTEIVVTYDAEITGVFNKTVTLTMNIEKSSQILHLKGIVVK
ncbi:MAG: DUF1573 domain-containing protein [Bacteroidetes bacterium]|nr:MAG: DUF1573 domain-containing protein [Bacteroidota bacterium]